MRSPVRHDRLAATLILALGACGGDGGNDGGTTGDPIELYLGGRPAERER